MQRTFNEGSALWDPSHIQVAHFRQGEGRRANFRIHIHGYCLDCEAQFLFAGTVAAIETELVHCSLTAITPSRQQRFALTQATPEHIARCARAAFNTRHEPIACMAMVRTSLELIAKEMGAGPDSVYVMPEPKGGNFVKHWQLMEALLHAQPKLKPLVSALLAYAKLGNDALHDGWEPSNEECDAGLALLEATILLRYEHPGRMASLLLPKPSSE